MYFANITHLSRRNFVPAAQYFKPLAVFCRSQKTGAAQLERNEALRDSAKIDIKDGGVRPFEDIPGPKKTFKFMIDFYRQSEGLHKGYKPVESWFAKYGPIFKENSLGPYFVHVIDPNDIEKVFRAEGKYPRRFEIDVWLEHRKRRNYFPGVVLLNGEEWHRIRQSIAPKMMRPKTVEENIDNFNDVAEDAISRFVKLKQACGPDDHIPDLEGELTRWSTEGIGAVAFDTRLGLYEDRPPQEALKFIEAVQNFFLLSHKLLFSIPSNMMRRYIDTPALKKFLKVADDVLDIGQGFVDKKMREIKEMSEKDIEPSGDTQVVPLLTYLLTKENLTMEEVNALANDVVFAGVDTTSTSMLWLLYHLGRHPHIQEKLYREVENVVGKERDIAANKVGKLSYLKACLKESMRVTPVIAGNSRILDQDIVLSGYNIPAQTTIVTEFYCTSRSEKYCKDPLEFKPERWLRENKEEIHAFSSLPFGFGTRMCLGRRVAELEIYVFVCKLLQRFRIEYDGEPLELYQKIVAVPDKPVKIKFVDRV